MPEIFLFAGTSEGRTVSEYLSACGVKYRVFVATDYGAEMLEKIENAEVCIGKLDTAELIRRFSNSEALVIDAAHPYAAELHKNLKTACAETGTEYIRLLRPSVSAIESVEFRDHKSAAEHLSGTVGAVLLTIGSRSLAEYTAVHDFESRIYVRVLPDAESIEKCTALGFGRKNIIAMQGPFTKEMNTALIHSIDAKYIVTKDTGHEGGFIEKIEAAKECDAKVIVIARPIEDTGLTFDALKTELASRFEIKEQAKVQPQLDAFPIFIPMRGKKALIIGGGNVAERRVAVLLEFGAEITVIAPKVTVKLMEYSRAGKISLLIGRFMDSYINETYKFVIAATNDRKVNKRIGLVGRKFGILVNIADSRTESDFHFPAVVSGGGVVGGVISESIADHKLVKEKAEILRQALRTEI